MKGSLNSPISESNSEDKKAVLVLEDGTLVQGKGFGAVKKVSGEVVFNTGMVGYTEAITDVSYNGQILIQTYPLIGNYGVSPEHFESDGPKIEGYIVHEVCRNPSHWSAKWTLDEFLDSNGVPGIEGVDTRSLTKKIRIHGVMLGLLQVYRADQPPDFEQMRSEAEELLDPNEKDLVAEVSTHEMLEHKASGRTCVVLIDCGVKKNIVRCLLDRKISVLQVPPTLSADKILEYEPDGVVISNGPGDPKRIPHVIETVRDLVHEKMPVLGICLGNQLLALALGGDTYKMKFGHRGQNHPCVDLRTGKCYITSQNHGYAVKPQSLADTVLEVTFVNANDETVEAVEHRSLPVFATQWHPEASPGPNDTNFLFDKFLKSMEVVKNPKN